MNKHLLSGCSTAVNFAKLTTFSSVLTAAVTLQHVTAVKCTLWPSTAIERMRTWKMVSEI